PEPPGAPGMPRADGRQTAEDHRRGDARLVRDGPRPGEAHEGTPGARTRRLGRLNQWSGEQLYPIGLLSVCGGPMGHPVPEVVARNGCGALVVSHYGERRGLSPPFGPPGPSSWHGLLTVPRAPTEGPPFVVWRRFIGVKDSATQPLACRRSL